MHMLPETLPELSGRSSSKVNHDSPHDPRPDGCDSTDMEEEELSVSVAPPRHSQRQYQEPDRYTSVRSILSTQGVARRFASRRGSEYSSGSNLCGEYS